MRLFCVVGLGLGGGGGGGGGGVYLGESPRMFM